MKSSLIIIFITLLSYVLFSVQNLKKDRYSKNKALKEVETVYNCSCVDRFKTEVDKDYLIEKIQLKNLKIKDNDPSLVNGTYSMTFINNKNEILFDLVVEIDSTSLKVVSENGTKLLLFSFLDKDETNEADDHVNFAEYEPFGNKVTNRKFQKSKTLGELLSCNFEIDDFVPSDTPFIHEAIVSQTYGILAFGYYDGNRNIKCVSKNLANPEEELTEWKFN